MGAQEWKQLARPPKHDSTARCVVKLRVQDGGAHQGPSDLLGDLVRGHRHATAWRSAVPSAPRYPRSCVIPAIAATQERTTEFQVRWSECHGLRGGRYRSVQGSQGCQPNRKSGDDGGFGRHYLLGADP